MLSKMPAVACLLVVALGGCATGSANVATADISPTFRIVVDTNGTATATAALETGTVTRRVRLDSGDELEVTHRKQTFPLLVADDSDDGLMYSAEIPDVRAGEELTISFTRVEREDAPSSVATIPEDFDITSPAPGDLFSRERDSIQVIWSNPVKGDMHYAVSGDCVFDDQGREPDEGSITIDAGDLAFGEETGPEDTGTGTGGVTGTGGEPTSDTCDMTVLLERRSSGTVDPAFDDAFSSIQGVQAREIILRSEP